MANETPAYEYSVAMKGLWGRNRKAKFQLIRIARTGSQMDRETVLAKTLEICKNEKVKPGCHVAVTEQYGTITDYGDGLRSFSFDMFSGCVTMASAWVAEDGTINLS